jgi:demethylmenaquinone methyltransferase/2-methoxy-6-polyprenyl-1,4-benzoquinol methylase
MFDGLPSDYDRWNRLLSWGMDRRWRYRAVRPMIRRRLVCDLGAGTGDMARALLRHRPFRGEIIAIDPSRTLWTAPDQHDLHHQPRCRFALAEGEHLPLPDGACDGLMSGFVMRNFFDLDLALREAYRVVSPGGEAVFLELGHPGNPLWRWLFNLYFRRIAPSLAAFFARRPAAYRYLPASLARFPHQADIRMRFLANGWRGAEYKEYLGGAIVVYRAQR